MLNSSFKKTYDNAPSEWVYFTNGIKTLNLIGLVGKKRLTEGGIMFDILEFYNIENDEPTMNPYADSAVEVSEKLVVSELGVYKTYQEVKDAHVELFV